MDNMDLLAANDTKDHSATSITQSMQEGLDQWELGLRVSGGALSRNKSHWTLINFDWEGEIENTHHVQHNQPIYK